MLKCLSCFRGNLDEAIDKLQSVADLSNPSLGVKGNVFFSFLCCFKKDQLLICVDLCLMAILLALCFVIVAAMEALVGLHLEMGQVSNLLAFVLWNTLPFLSALNLSGDGLPI